MTVHSHSCAICQLGKILIRRLRPDYGTRPSASVIQNRLQNALANALLGGEFTEGATIRVNEQHGELTFDAG